MPLIQWYGQDLGLLPNVKTVSAYATAGAKARIGIVRIRALSAASVSGASDTIAVVRLRDVSAASRGGATSSAAVARRRSISPAATAGANGIEAAGAIRSRSAAATAGATSSAVAVGPVNTVTASCAARAGASSSCTAVVKPKTASQPSGGGVVRSRVGGSRYSVHDPSKYQKRPTKQQQSNAVTPVEVSISAGRHLRRSASCSAEVAHVRPGWIAPVGRVSRIAPLCPVARGPRTLAAMAKRKAAG